MEFKIWLESSFEDLYQSSVDAFPHTTKRQHVLVPIRVTDIKWTPYVGVKTLFVKGLAQNEDRAYNPMIVFKNVKYHTQMSKNLIVLNTEGKKYFLEQLSLDNNDVLLRCQCGDFHWRGNYPDHLDKSLFGSLRKKYESLGLRPPANPTNAPMMCKHIMKLGKVLKETGLLI